MSNAIRMKHGQKLWMLRLSPHNEDFILKVARMEQDLIWIAENYVREIYDLLTFLKASVDWGKGEVEAVYGYEGAVEPIYQTFYISEVELL